jgi:L-alanine-DL-glutamate epimerase-like enolase superfamily enzyme
MSVRHSGGITHLRRILHLAELYRVRSEFHGERIRSGNRRLTTL